MEKNEKNGDASIYQQTLPIFSDSLRFPRITNCHMECRIGRYNAWIFH